MKPWPPSANPCFFNANHSRDCLPGVELEILLTLLERLGVKHYTLHSNNEPGCGELDVDQNGTVRNASGLMAMLFKGEIDVTGIVCSFSQKRSSVFGYVWPLIYSRQIFVIKTPDVTKEDSDIRRPFGWEIWYAIAAIFAAIVFLRIFSAWILKKNFKKTTLKWIWILLETTFGLDKRFCY